MPHTPPLLVSLSPDETDPNNPGRRVIVAVVARTRINGRGDVAVSAEEARELAADLLRAASSLDGHAWGPVPW